MSYLLPHLHSGWAVDQAILTEEERVVIIRFGHDWDDTCMQLYLVGIMNATYDTPRRLILNLEEGYWARSPITMAQLGGQIRHPLQVQYNNLVSFFAIGSRACSHAPPRDQIPNLKKKRVIFCMSSYVSTNFSAYPNVSTTITTHLNQQNSQLILTERG